MDIFPTLYRYAECYESEHCGYEIKLLEYQPVKETPGGWWILRDKSSYHSDWRKQHKWIGKLGSFGRKRFAYETKELAWESYVIRKRKRVMHLKRDLEVAKALLEMALNKEMNRETEMGTDQFSEYIFI